MTLKDKPHQIAGRFTGHFDNAILILCDESVWRGDKAAKAELLRKLVEDKNMPITSVSTSVSNFKRFTFAAKEDY